MSTELIGSLKFLRFCVLPVTTITAPKFSPKAEFSSHCFLQIEVAAIQCYCHVSIRLYLFFFVVVLFCLVFLFVFVWYIFCLFCILFLFCFCFFDQVNQGKMYTMLFCLVGYLFVCCFLLVHTVFLSGYPGTLVSSTGLEEMKL